MVRFLAVNLRSMECYFYVMCGEFCCAHCNLDVLVHIQVVHSPAFGLPKEFRESIGLEVEIWMDRVRSLV